MTRVEIVFCTDLLDLPGQDAPAEAREYAMFMHEAEVFMWALAGAVEHEKMSPQEALAAWEPYQMTWPLDEEDLEDFHGGFPSKDWLMDCAPGPGSQAFWRAADMVANELGISGVHYEESNHPGGWPTFEVHGSGTLESVCKALNGRYKVLAKDQREYDTSGSFDPEQAQEIIRRARMEPGFGGERG